MDVHQEEDRIAGVPITIVLTVALGVAAVLGLWALQMMRSREHALRPSDRWPEATLPAPTEISGIEQQLFDEPAQGLSERELVRKRLGSYGWVDREREIVHIPIDRAIDLYLERQGGAR